MSLSEIAFIINPNAGNGSTGSDWPIIKKLARDRLGPFTTYITSGPGDAILLTKEAIVKGAGLVICVGGDGTLNEVVNGYMEQKNSARADLRLGFVPNGTGCDFARTALIPKDIEESINIIVTNKVRSIDVGRLVFKDHNGFSCSRFFLNIAGFG
ncbi:MAG: acylglycerol kinase family protein, partial [Desulfobacterales bacterium]